MPASPSRLDLVSQFGQVRTSWLRPCLAAHPRQQRRKARHEARATLGLAALVSPCSKADEHGAQDLPWPGGIS